jgi:hypothetical protein
MHVPTGDALASHVRMADQSPFAAPFKIDVLGGFSNATWRADPAHYCVIPRTLRYPGVHASLASVTCAARWRPAPEDIHPYEWIEASRGVM